MDGGLPAALVDGLAHLLLLLEDALHLRRHPGLRAELRLVPAQLVHLLLQRARLLHPADERADLLRGVQLPGAEVGVSPDRPHVLLQLGELGLALLPLAHARAHLLHAALQLRELPAALEAAGAAGGRGAGGR